MEAKKALLPLAREFVKTLKPQRYPAVYLQEQFQAANPEAYAPKQALGMIWREIGLRRIKSNGDRYWEMPAILTPPPIPERQPSRQPRAKRRATVDIACLGLKPGDGFVVTYSPDAITIRKATPGIEVK